MNSEAAGESVWKEHNLGAVRYFQLPGAWRVPHDGPVNLGTMAIGTPDDPYRVFVTDWDKIHAFVADSADAIVFDEFVPVPFKDRLLLVTPLVGFKV